MDVDVNGCQWESGICYLKKFKYYSSIKWDHCKNVKIVLVHRRVQVLGSQLCFQGPCNWGSWWYILFGTFPIVFEIHFIWGDFPIPLTISLEYYSSARNPTLLQLFAHALNRGRSVSDSCLTVLALNYSCVVGVLILDIDLAPHCSIYLPMTWTLSTPDLVITLLFALTICLMT